MGTKVTLRHKPITNGRESLYLDFYPPIRCKATMKLVHKEYLGIYIYQNPQNEIQRDYNREMTPNGGWATNISKNSVAASVRSVR